MKSMKTSLPSLGTDNSENNGSSAQDDDDITNIKVGNCGISMSYPETHIAVEDVPCHGFQVFIRLRPLEDGQEPSSNVFKLRERSLTISVRILRFYLSAKFQQYICTCSSESPKTSG